MVGGPLFPLVRPVNIAQGVLQQLPSFVKRARARNVGVRKAVLTEHPPEAPRFFQTAAPRAA
jgi:hypothetical protein